MRLYAGMSPEFIRASTHNQIADRLSAAFRSHFRYEPPHSEIRSWRESLRAMAQIMTEGDLTDHGVILEYQLPLTSKRLDCLITGHDVQKRDSAVVVELKQWDRCTDTEGEGLVRTFVGGAPRDVLHPSAQANQYRRYLADMHEAFHEDNPVQLAACAYLHNYHTDVRDPIYAEKFADVRGLSPLFDADAVPALLHFLTDRLRHGDGQQVLERVERSKFRPSKRLLDHVNGVIGLEPRFVLLDEQQVVFSRIVARVRAGLDHRRKHVFLIHGGPGTGKSVLAINLMAVLSGEGRNAQYATGSQAFTETLRKIVGKRAAQQFKYFNNYGMAEPNAIDVLLCDESHRIRESSNNRYTRTTHRSSKPQIQEIIDAAKVSVFFIDDRQIVRPREVGSSELIRTFAERNGCALEEHKLEAQFRCAGSASYLNWVENTLGIERTATPIWSQENESFEFQIVGTPDDLDKRIRERALQGHTARLVAGYCWPWSHQPNRDGSLVEDVTVGSFRRPWNAHSEARGLRKGIPAEKFWAYDGGGIDQIGCIYTAQGFEFDYVGVIWGADLTYDPGAADWKGHSTKSFDSMVRASGDRFTSLVKNTYRTLLSRGLRGCYVYFVDKETEKFVRSRTEGLGKPPMPAAQPVPPQIHAENETVEVPFRRVPQSAVQPYVNCVPLVDLKFAAGVFGEADIIDRDEVEWVILPDHFQPRPGLFVAQVVGESMNRKIPNGAWCLFKMNPSGTRQGKVVVAQHPDIGDPDLGGSFTVKVYQSEKTAAEDDSWRHVAVRLCPDSTDNRFVPIVIDASAATEVRIVAELVAVLEG